MSRVLVAAPVAHSTHASLGARAFENFKPEVARRKPNSTLGRLRYASLIFAVALCPRLAQAQDAVAGYPSKPVRIVVPISPGNTPDALARVISERLADSLHQPFIVENRAGAGGAIGAGFVAKAPADGYTLLVGDAGTMIVNPAINAKLPYSTKDFTPVSLLATSYFYLAVQRSLPVSNVEEFIALVKSKPKQFNYASAGIGSPHHLMFETLMAETGMHLVHVPYKGGAQAVVGLLAGEVAVMFSGLPQLDPHVRSGALKIIAVASAQRSPQRPQIPTLGESGVRDMDFPGDLALFAPVGTPVAILSKLATEIDRAIHQADTVKRLDALGVVPIGGARDALAAHFESQIDKYVRAAKAAGLKSE